MDEQEGGYEGRTSWTTASELPAQVYDALRKPGLTINPVAIVATIDPDGAPHTAPFGSVRAVTPRILRILSLRYHDTFINLCRDGRVAVAVVAPPDIAVSIQGQARVLKEQMDADEHSALLDVDIETVKNDMVRTGTIESGIAFSPLERYKSWFDAVLLEMDEA
jgi:hypothetical protein